MEEKLCLGLNSQRVRVLWAGRHGVRDRKLRGHVSVTERKQRGLEVGRGYELSKSTLSDTHLLLQDGTPLNSASNQGPRV